MLGRLSRPGTRLNVVTAATAAGATLAIVVSARLFSTGDSAAKDIVDVRTTDAKSFPCKSTILASP
jgi:hypothetical protein